MQNQDYQDFLKNITELKDLAMLCGGFITDEQIAEAFPDLNEEQKSFIVEYFEKNHIGINKPIDAKSFLSEDEINLLDMYLESLDAVERLDESKKRAMMMAALNNDKAAKEALINHYLQDVVDTAKLYSGQGVNMMDLIGEGNVALTLSMDSLDCVETIEDIEPLIMRMIMNAMEDIITEESDENKIDKKVLDLVEKVREKAKEMTDELLREVTVDELVKESGISAKNIRTAMLISKELNDLIKNDISETVDGDMKENS